MIALLALVSTALAGVGVSAGVSHITNDPFQRVVGLEGSAIASPGALFDVELRVALHPLTGTLARTPLANHLVEELQIAPDLSLPRLRAELSGAFMPLHMEQGRWSARGGLFAGAGVIRTVDDLEFFQAEDDPEYVATEIELHPTWLFGLTVEALRGPVGVRVRSQQVRYTETIGSEVQEEKHPTLVAVDLIVRI